MRDRVAKRNKNLLDDSLQIDEHAFDLFKHRFEALATDEPHIVIKTNLDLDNCEQT